MLIATTSIGLTQGNVHNISILNEKLAEAKSKNKKLEEEKIDLKAEVNKKKKVDDHLNSLKDNILIEQYLLHYAKTEFCRSAKDS